MRTQISRWNRAVLGVVVAAVVASGAAGQPPERGVRGGFGPGAGLMGLAGTPQVPSESVERYARLLKLTPEQRAIVDRAYEAYEHQLRSEREAMQEAMRQAFMEAREGGERGAGLEEMTENFREMRDRAAQLEREFFDEIKRQLTAEQRALWPKVERARRRERASGGMMIASGERVDLVAVIDGMRLSPAAREAVTPILEQYEEDLDRELAARERVNEEVAEAMTGLRGLAGGGQMDGARAQLAELMEKARMAGARVADVNRRYTARVQGALPEDKRPAFLQAVKEARFADVYRPSTGARAIEVALAMEDLDDAQRAKIEAIRANYERLTANVNARLASALEKAEGAGAQRTPPRANPQPGQPGGRGGQGRDRQRGAAPNQAGGMRFMGEDADTIALRREKAGIDRDTIQRLREVLTPEQAQRLPALDQGQGRWRGGEGQQPGRPVRPGGDGGRR